MPSSARGLYCDTPIQGSAIELKCSLLVLVACGGLYMERNYAASVATQSADEVVREARAGRYGALGEIGETPHAPMSALERKVFKSTDAHLRTNLPIFTYNAYGTGPNVPRDAGVRQLDAFELVGVDPRRIAIGDMFCLDDPRPRSSLRARGAAPSWASIAYRAVWCRRQESGDGARVPRRRHGRPPAAVGRLQLQREAPRAGYANALTMFVPKLRQAGVSEVMLRQITVDNPNPFLAFVLR
jgi:predicted metal-dependent phosphotriesterase family hydrolase